MYLIERKIMYKAFGLNINSELPLPELPTVNGSIESIDVEIGIDDLSKQWLVLSGVENDFVVKENLIMFQAPNIATFSITRGKTITISPIGDGDIDKIRLFVLGTCMGALLMQRKVLPLHGSAIVIDGKAYAFVGERGAGKSTIAAALLRRGYRFLTDDVIALKQVNDHYPYVIPSYPQQKLWQESLEAFGEKTNQFQPLYERETKFAVPVLDKYYSKPLPLAGVFELIKAKNGGLGIRPLQKLESLHTLYIHTFRQFLLNGLGLRPWHLNTTASMASHLEIYQLQRPTTTFTADELATLVLETVKEEKTNYDRNKNTIIE